MAPPPMEGAAAAAADASLFLCWRRRYREEEPAALSTADAAESWLWHGIMTSELVSHHASDANAPRDAVAQRVEARRTFLLPMAQAQVRTRTQGQHTCVTVHRLEKKV